MERHDGDGADTSSTNFSTAPIGWHWPRNAFAAARAADRCRRAIVSRRPQRTTARPFHWLLITALWGKAAAALYAATGKPHYGTLAEADADHLHAHFADAARGGYFSNRIDEAGLLVNNRAMQDNAQPSANAAALALFTDLASMTGKVPGKPKRRMAFKRWPVIWRKITPP